MSDQKDIIETLKENPEQLNEILNHESFRSTVEEHATKAVLDSRDKVLKTDDNWKAKASDLQSQLDTLKATPTPTPEVKPTGTKAPVTDPALLERLSTLEKSIEQKDRLLNNTKVASDRDAALAGYAWKDGGMNTAQKLINLDNFVMNDDGIARHKDTGMNMKDYIAEEAIKSDLKYLVDGAASGGAGAKGSKGTTTITSVKKFSDATVGEKTAFINEHGEAKYQEWKNK